jgi:hypothetical protein
MIMAILVLALLALVVLVNVFAVGEKISRKMTLAEEAQYEITDHNVQDVINQTIETGLDHPALAARKAQSR